MEQLDNVKINVDSKGLSVLIIALAVVMLGVTIDIAIIAAFCGGLHIVSGLILASYWCCKQTKTLEV